MPASKHTPEQRARALALCEEFGAADAARLLTAEGLTIQAETIRQWASRAGVSQRRTETMRANVDALTAKTAERRTRLAARLLEIAEGASEHAAEMMADANLRDVVGLFTRAIHDHQLLSGGATSRVETAPTAEAETILDELDELAKRRGAA